MKRLRVDQKVTATRVLTVCPSSEPVTAPTRLSVFQWIAFNRSRTKLLRYQLAPIVAAQPRPPVTRSV